MLSLLFVVGMSFTSYFKAFKASSVNVALAEDEEDSHQEADKKDEGDSKDKSDEKDHEDSKENDDDQERAKKSSTERSLRSNVTKESENDDENDSEDGNEVDEDGGDSKDSVEQMSELSRDITKVENKIGVAEKGGMDVSALRSALDEVKAMVADAQSKLDAGNAAEAKATAQAAKRKLETIEHSLEIFLENDDEDNDSSDEDDDAEEVASKYKNSVAAFVHDLKEVGDSEGKIGQQVRLVAQAQNQNKEVVSSLIDDVDARGKVLSFIFGPDYKSLDKIKQQIAANESNIQSLTASLAQIQDAYAKTVLQAQIKVLTQENARLQKFVDNVGGQPSIFGWLMRALQ